MIRKDLVLFRAKAIIVEQLNALIAAEYAENPIVVKAFELKNPKHFMTYFMLQDDISRLAEDLSIAFTPYNCVSAEANNIVRLLKEYPDLINDFLLMKMRRMKALYKNPANAIEREYALANATFIKAIVEKDLSAIKICALRQCHMNIFRVSKPTRLYSTIIGFKVTEGLLTESDFQHHLNAIERAAYRLKIVQRRLLTKKERDSGKFGNKKYFYPHGEEIKEYLQKQIEKKAKSTKRRKPLNYRLNASQE